MKKPTTKKQKVEKAKKIAQLMRGVLESKEKGNEIYWGNVWERILWILED